MAYEELDVVAPDVLQKGGVRTLRLSFSNADQQDWEDLPPELISQFDLTHLHEIYGRVRGTASPASVPRYLKKGEFTPSKKELRTFRGPSIQLAYLLTLFSASRQALPVFRGVRLWATGEITSDLELGPVDFLNEKLAAFLASSHRPAIFLCPFLNREHDRYDDTQRSYRVDTKDGAAFLAAWRTEDLVKNFIEPGDHRRLPSDRRVVVFVDRLTPLLGAIFDLRFINGIQATSEAIASETKAASLEKSSITEFLIQELTAGFVGRAHVFSAVDAFLGSVPSGYFVIRGSPGIGKSTVLAEFARRTGCIIHFVSQALGYDGTARFLEAACDSLIRRFNLSWQELPAGAVTDGAFLSRLLWEASAKVPSGQRLVVAVDALDEVADRPGNANILFLPQRLPNNVYFVLTQRPATLPLRVNTALAVYDLDEYRAENELDTATYISSRLVQPNLVAWMSRRALEPAAVVDLLKHKADGNFMYLHYVLSDLERGVYNDLTLENLPAGLEGYYEDHWRHMGMANSPPPLQKITIVYVLAEARRPLSRALIADLSGHDPLTVQGVLDEWRPFLRASVTHGQPTYTVYHLSFRDFLNRRDIVQAAGISLQEIHSSVATNLWSAVFDEDEN